MSSDDPFGQDGGGDWGEAPKPGPDDDNIDMNYGQPLSQPPPAGTAQQQPPPGQAMHQTPGQSMQQPPGNQLQSTKPKLDNDDIVPLILSAFFPGVGHMMLGQTTKGIVVLLAAIFTCGFGGLLNLAVILDCYLVAMTRKYRQLDDWEFFPDMNKHLGSG